VRNGVLEGFRLLSKTNFSFQKTKKIKTTKAKKAAHAGGRSRHGDFPGWKKKLLTRKGTGKTGKKGYAPGGKKGTDKPPGKVNHARGQWW